MLKIEVSKRAESFCSVERARSIAPSSVSRASGAAFFVANGGLRRADQQSKGAVFNGF